MDGRERIRLIKPLIARLARLPELEVRLIFREIADTPFYVGNETLDDTIQGYLSGSTDNILLEINEHVGGTGHLPGVSQETQDRIWSTGRFRLFMSHLHTRASDVEAVRSGLAAQGVDGFVAHAVIEPSRDWEEEIVAALRSCHAAAAFLHPGFKDSHWADQEVGYCLGRGLTLVPVCYEADPHGLMTRVQGVKAANKTPNKVSIEIVDALIANESTQDEMAPVIVSRLVATDSTTKATNWLGRLDRVRRLSPDLLTDLNTASPLNPVLADAGVRLRIQAVLDRHEFRPPTAPYGYDPNEEPF